MLAVFAVTFVPFNLFHHHADHGHAEAYYAHQNNEEHHCYLDDQLCQQGLETDCGHESHIQQSITKCFSCQFHFIKHFDSHEPMPVIRQYATPVTFGKLITGKLHAALIRISNKGPPQLV